MTLTATRILSLATLLVAGAGCHRTTPPPAPPVSPAGDWTLMVLDTQPAPTGAGGRHASLRFETDSARVAGFAGCNRLIASYTLAGDSVTATELTLFGVSGSLARFARATP